MEDQKKTLTSEFDKFTRLLISKTPFAFTRFSDGELSIIKNEELKLAEDHNIFRNNKNPASYTEEDRKHFIPNRDFALREKLISAISHKQDNYLIGISTPIDCPIEDYKLQFDYLGNQNNENITFSNLLCNKNYPRFIHETVFKHLVSESRNIIVVANEKSVIGNLPFRVSCFVEVGNNCIINDHQKIDKVLSLLSKEKDSIVLCSASSLSALIIHKAFKEMPNNTMINIGTTLNPILGFGITRAYQHSVWTPKDKWNHTVYELLCREENLFDS